LNFENFQKNEIFYFTFKSEDSEGKSDLFPCEGLYNFVNKGKFPVEFSLFYSNGKSLGNFNLNPNNMNLPIIKKYTTDYIDVSSDEVISFYLPVNKIRYEASSNINKNLSVNTNSPVFTGKFRLEAKQGESSTFKIKFGSFDKNGNLITESQYYYLTIDRQIPSGDVSADGVDFTIYHNEQQKIKLIPPDKKLKIFYRLNEDNDWIPYNDNIVLNPPLTGVSEVKIYVKSVDGVGNERLNSEPYVIKFDRRGIFVNSSQKFSGNGTESSPFNSIERSVYFAKLKNIKIVYLLSDEYNISVPVNIESDIIIEPYNSDRKAVINLDTKSIWKKQHIWFDFSLMGYLEMRNLTVNIKSGYLFANMKKNKLKIYNTDFSFSGKNDFCFIKNDGGKIGINNITFFSTENADNFTFIDTSNSSLILKNIKTKFIGNNIKVFNILGTKDVVMDTINTEITANSSMQFSNISSSNITANNIIYRQTGDMKNTNIFTLLKSSMKLSESDFIIDGSSPFETSFVYQTSSKTEILKSLFRIKSSFSSICFNSTESDLVFDQSMLDVQNIKDYTYDFRLDRSTLKSRSSIIRNYNLFSSVNFLLNNSKFEGANNSVFNFNIEKKSFSFWINDKAVLTTVNSLYCYSNQNEKSTFIYANNNDYSILTPVWYSNAISSDIVLLENLDKKDSPEIIKDFNNKNIYYQFDGDFNMTDEKFFLPQKDSPLLQGGMDDTKSPVSIPERDFLGKIRILSGIGIDIGAIQKTGNF
jgi:hypothetical protein